MKTAIIFLFLLLPSISLLAQDSEKQAIIKVIEDGHFAACERDFEKYASYFDQNEKVLWGDGINYSCRGWDEVVALVKPHYEKYPNPLETAIFYNYQISIAGAKAWATFDKKKKGGSDPISKEQRILVKKNGEWKLVAMLFFPI